MTGPVLESGTDAEIAWVDCAEDGATQLTEGNTHGALEQWRQGHAIADRFAGHDPRLAASLNNLAIGQRMTGDLAQAEHHYRLALDAWHASAEWVQDMQVSAQARSSLFHLRLELRHRAQYRHSRIERLQRDLTTGRAASINNLAELLHITKRLADARELYIDAARQRGAAQPDDDPGLQTIATNLALLAGSPTRPALPPVCAGTRPFSELAEQNRWVVDLPTVFTDEGRLMAGLLCTYLLDHGAAITLTGKHR